MLLFPLYGRQVVVPVLALESVAAIAEEHEVALVEPAQKLTRFDRSHFLKHGDAALEFETVYIVLTADYNQFMDIQQTINLQMHRRFSDLDIDFAYPVQKVMVVRPGEHDQVTEEKVEDRGRATGRGH